MTLEATEREKDCIIMEFWVIFNTCKYSCPITIMFFSFDYYHSGIDLGRIGKSDRA